MVASATFSCGPASIITGPRAWGHASSLVRWAMNSVWPGKPKSAVCSTALAIGSVTSAEAAPSRTAATPWAIAAIVACALTGSGSPGVSSIASGVCRTASAPSANVKSAALDATRSAGLAAPMRVQARSKASGSPTKKNGGAPSRAAQTRAASSRPIPAGSPIETASGFMASLCAGYDGGFAAQVAQIAVRQHRQFLLPQPLFDLVSIRYGRPARFAPADHDDGGLVATDDDGRGAPLGNAVDAAANSR